MAQRGSYAIYRTVSLRWFENMSTLLFEMPLFQRVVLVLLLLTVRLLTLGHCGFLLALSLGSLTLGEATCHVWGHSSSPVQRSSCKELRPPAHGHLGSRSLSSI